MHLQYPKYVPHKMECEEPTQPDGMLPSMDEECEKHLQKQHHFPAVSSNAEPAFDTDVAHIALS